jgi:hypothetical protein
MRITLTAKTDNGNSYCVIRAVSVCFEVKAERTNRSGPSGGFDKLATVFHFFSPQKSVFSFQFSVCISPRTEN